MIQNKEKNFMSAVVYVRNNEQDIEKFFTTIEDILNRNFEKYELIFVNDASTDKSREIIKKIAAKFTDKMMIQILDMSFYQGIEASMKAGVDLAIGDFVFEFDTMNISYKPELLMSVYYRSLKGYDIVSAAPKKVKQNSSKIFYYLFNKYTQGQYLLRTETFRILSRRAINRISSLSKTIPYRKAMYAVCGLPMDSIEYDNIINENIVNRSDNRSERRKLAIDSLILFTNIASRWALYLSLIMVVFSVLIGAYIIYTYCTYSKIVEGWTTTMAMICIGFFGVFSILAVMIKYLDLLLRIVFKKQQYVISNIEKLK